MIMPTKLEIKRFRGDTYGLTLRLTQNSMPLDLTGKTFKLSAIMPAKKGTSDYAFQVDGTAVGSPAAGIIDFALTDQMAASTGVFDYDVQMTDSGKKRTILYGQLIFVQDVTQ